MDEFVIEKYIEINIGISTGIVYADPNPHFFGVTIRQKKGDREHVRIFIAKDITKKLTLACGSN